MLEKLKKNIEHEKKIVQDMVSVQMHIENSPQEKDFYNSSLKALGNQLRMVNNSLPDLLRGVKFSEEVRQEEQKKEKKSKPKVVSMSYTSPSDKKKKFVTINKEDRNKFLKELHISEKGLKNFRKEEKSSLNAVKKPSVLAGISNRFFRGFSDKLVPTFESLSGDLKKANVHFLLATYISIALFVSSLAFVGGLILGVVLFLVGFSFWFLFLPFGFLLLSLAGFYFYPASAASSAQKKISQELPFATIHMAAIAGAEIEPTKIFKIIAKSKEYKHVGYEMRKVVSQVEIYGYNFITALKNVGKLVSNKDLAELFNGVATSVSTGGDLKNYLEKKAENFLNDYRLRAQRYSKIAETFMDVYISVLVAGPLVLMLMFIVMSVSGFGVSIGIDLILAITIGFIVIANIIFLFVLEVKQPAL